MRLRGLVEVVDVLEMFLLNIRVFGPVSLRKTCLRMRDAGQSCAVQTFPDVHVMPVMPRAFWARTASSECRFRNLCSACVGGRPLLRFVS